jgi:hypothetical protein
MVETSSFIPEEALKPHKSRGKKSGEHKSGEEIAISLAKAGKVIEKEKHKKLSHYKTGEEISAALAAAGNPEALVRRKKIARYQSGEEIVAALAEAGKAIKKVKSKENEEHFDKLAAGYEKEGQEAAEPPYASIEVSTEEQPAPASQKKRVTNKHVIKRVPKEEIMTVEPEDIVSEEENTDVDYKPFKVSEAESKPITSEQAPVVSGEINNEYVLEKRVTNKNVISRASHEAKKLKAQESRSNEATTDYVEAYKKYDPRFTKNKSDDQIAKSKPPFFAFGKAARELKRLYVVMVRAEDSKLGGLSPEARQAIMESAKKEEEEFIESNKKFAPGKEDKE